MLETTEAHILGKSPAFQQNGVPLYMQLAAFMRRSIEIGAWPVGTKIPSLDVMAESFGIARLTVRQAVQLLVGENILTSKQGRGTFVSTAPAQVHRTKLQTSWQALISRFEGAEVTIISEADVDCCPSYGETEHLMLPSYHFMKRVHCRDGVPFCLIDVYLDQEIFQRAPHLLLANPVLTVLGQLNIKVSKARQTLTIGTADSEMAHFLKISPGDPVAFVRRFAQYKNGFTFYMGDVVYRGDCVYQDIDLLL